jgi:hypothetical protein
MYTKLKTKTKQFKEEVNNNNKVKRIKKCKSALMGNNITTEMGAI